MRSISEIPEIKIGKYTVKDYCSICPNRNLCDNFTFTNIMYSKIPSILAFSQLSLSKLKEQGITNKEYMRIVTYNMRYVSFMEDIYHLYRKIIQSMQLSQFKFDVRAYMIIDEFFHIFIKWFEKLILWNRVNSIKAKECIYYNKLLENNIEFIFALLKDDIINSVGKEFVDLINLDFIKDQFLTKIIPDRQPKTNGDYFNHTRNIRDNLSEFLESLSFLVLSYFRSIQSNHIYMYIVSSMYCPDLSVIFNRLIVNLLGNLSKHIKSNEIKLRVLSKNFNSGLILMFQHTIKANKLNFNIQTKE